MASRSPWKRPNPKKRHTTLTAESKRLARARARRAGRAYPNLVDNMYAAKLQSRGGGAKARKRTTKSTAKSTAKSTTKSTRKRTTKSTAKSTRKRTTAPRRKRLTARARKRS
jgi:hypothetical protein